METRLFTAEDFTAVLGLERVIFPDAWTEEMLRKETEKSEFCAVVAEERGKIVGYLYGTVLFEDGEIEKIAVVPTYRGKGYAKALAAAFEEEILRRGGKRIFLQVRPSNLAALTLYKGLGFTQTRVCKRYYSDGEDGLEMLKNLK